MNFGEWAVNKIISTLFAIIPRAKPTAERLSSTRLVAHRGVHEGGRARENSAPAFDLCVEHKIWATELDVRFTADNRPIITHDETARRNWGVDLIFAKSTLAEIRARISGLLTLDEVVSRYGRRLHLMIEIKENLAARPERIEILKRVLAPLTPGDDYHLLALDPQLLEPLTFAPKSCYLDVIWLDAKTMFEKNRRLGHGAIAGHFLFFSDQKIIELHLLGVKVGVGFLDSKNSLYREIHRGADYIFTDKALTLSRWLRPHH